MSNFYDNALNDPFGSDLFASLDKLEDIQYNFNTDTRIDVFVDQQATRDHLPLIYYKNRWLEDQLEVKEIRLYKNEGQVVSAIIITGRQQ